MSKHCWALSALIVCASVAPAKAATRDCVDNPEIAWRVEGGFATFIPEAADRADALLDAIAAAGGRMQPGDPRSSSAYDAIVRLLVDDAPGESWRQGSKPLYEQTYWKPSLERYDVSDAVLNPSSVAILASFKSEGDCMWTVDAISTRGPCQGVRLTLKRGQGGVGGTIAVRSALGATAATCAAIEDRLIVGLGDSYASGEGNPDRPTRWQDIAAVRDAPRVAPLAISTKNDRKALWDRQRNGPLKSAPVSADAKWWDNSCHRSLLSQQALGAMAYAAENRHRRVLFLSFACSGATIFDGVAGPRLETPGAMRPGGLGRSSVALKESQIAQTLFALCADRTDPVALEIPETARTWRYLNIAGQPRPTTPRSLSVTGCKKWRRAPDALLLTIGGNDVGFGGVGVWAIMPSNDRSGLLIKLVPAINRSIGAGAVKKGFGLVCPARNNERRCRAPTLLASTLEGELPVMFDMLDEALNRAALSATPVKLQMRYPPVTLDQDGRLKGCLDAIDDRYAFLDEPWMPQYNLLLDKPVPMDFRGRWSFGIRDSEMGLIDRGVLSKLNNIVSSRTSWTVLGETGLPGTHGLCAMSSALAALDPAKPRDLRAARALALKEFGWPRFSNGWVSDRLSPVDWQPYAPRARWFRTAADSALTQSVFDGGTNANASRNSSDRLGEGTSGTIHPALPMHAAMGEQLAKALREAFARR